MKPQTLTVSLKAVTCFYLTDVKGSRGGRAKHNFLIDILIVTLMMCPCTTLKLPLLSLKQDWIVTDSVLSSVLSFYLFLPLSYCG